jgi:Zn-dependent protease with chaperone function
VLCQTSPPLADSDIVGMVRAGKSASEIVSAISSCEPHFQLDPGSMDALTQAGVSDDLIRAMAARQNGRPVQAPVPSAPRPNPLVRSAEPPSPPKPAPVAPDRSKAPKAAPIRPQPEIPAPTVVADTTLLEQDLAYGLNLHGRIVASTPVIDHGEAMDRLREVFTNLVQTDLARSGPVPAHQVFYLHSSAVNAFASAGGRLYVTDGLMNAIQGDPGVLAFAMGHEIAHNVRQHGIKKLIRSIQRQQHIKVLRYRIALGDKKANWELIGYLAADKIAEAKIERNEEHEADQLGLLMSSQAGYHPAYAIVAARVLRERIGEQSKFGAFFSDHPRWTTREERAEQNYPEAARIFESRWGDGGSSPGGLPPALFKAGQVAVAHREHQYSVTVPFSARNVRSDRPVQVSVIEVSEHGEEEPVAILNRQLVADDQNPLVATVSDANVKLRRGTQFVRVVAVQDGREVYSTQLTKMK